MVCRLKDFVLVVLKLLMFMVCVTISISKIKFFVFSGTERAKQNQKKFKDHSKTPKLVIQSLFNKFQQIC